MGPGDRRSCHVGGPQWREVTDLPVDPVPDQLHPAVAADGLAGHLIDQRLRLDLFGVVAEVALRPGDVAPGPDDPRQVRPLIDPVGVHRGARVADQKGAGVPVGAGLGLGDVGRDGALRTEPDVAVGIDETGQDPGSAAHGDGVGDRLGADQAVHHPQVGRLTVGQKHAVEVEPCPLRVTALLAGAVGVGEERRLTQSRRRVVEAHRPLLRGVRCSWG